MQSVQSQGIAKQMILSIIDRVQAEAARLGEQRIEYVWLLTRKINHPMQRFSEKHGFVLKETFEGGGGDASAFAREGYDMDQYLTYIAKVEALCKGGRKSGRGDGE
ncbi:hypothetical protein HK104_006776 [Borealophlyctis nickersoniae]|nr:hypothetical protein HK104_006776 [Borealophlyctis nickersoniae]